MSFATLFPTQVLWASGDNSHNTLYIFKAGYNNTRGWVYVLIHQTRYGTPPRMYICVSSLGVVAYTSEYRRNDVHMNNSPWSETPFTKHNTEYYYQSIRV